MQTLRGHQNEFKRAIRQTAPDFRPLERSAVVDNNPIPLPSFLLNEETEGEQLPSISSRPIFVDEVMVKANG